MVVPLPALTRPALVSARAEAHGPAGPRPGPKDVVKAARAWPGQAAQGGNSRRRRELVVIRQWLHFQVEASRWPAGRYSTSAPRPALGEVADRQGPDSCVVLAEPDCAGLSGDRGRRRRGPVTLRPAWELSQLARIRQFQPSLSASSRAPLFSCKASRWSRVKSLLIPSEWRLVRCARGRAGSGLFAADVTARLLLAPASVRARARGQIERPPRARAPIATGRRGGQRRQAGATAAASKLTETEAAHLKRNLSMFGTPHCWPAKVPETGRGWRVPA